MWLLPALADNISFRLRLAFTELVPDIAGGPVTQVSEQAESCTSDSGRQLLASTFVAVAKNPWPIQLMADVAGLNNV